MRYTSADLMLRGAMRDVFEHGTVVSPRGHETIEVLSWSGTLLYPRARLVRNPARDIRVGYAAANVAWNLCKRDDVESICWWNPNGRYISDNGRRFHGANYGQRWDDSLKEAMWLLVADPDTRRAWVPIWRPEDISDHRDPMEPTFYSRDGKDVPCTLGFSLRRREERLDMQVVMRSQSLTILPYDLFLFAAMQELIANTMEIQLGELHWHCNSLHAYFRREHAIHEATRDWYDEIFTAKNVGSPEFRMLVEQMDPIDLDLAGARQRWGDFEHRVRIGAMTDAEAIGLDPMEQLMWDGRPRG